MFPRLLVGVLPNIKINDDVQTVKEILLKLEETPYCPCAIVKNENTKCMCKEFREAKSGMCHCGLYIKEED